MQKKQQPGANVMATWQVIKLGQYEFNQAYSFFQYLSVIYNFE